LVFHAREVPREPGSLLEGMVLGDRSHNLPLFSSVMTTTSLTHLTVVSGGNSWAETAGVAYANSPVAERKCRSRGFFRTHRVVLQDLLRREEVLGVPVHDLGPQRAVLTDFDCAGPGLVLSMRTVEGYVESILAHYG
jgi:hypothetical protein